MTRVFQANSDFATRDSYNLMMFRVQIFRKCAASLALVAVVLHAFTPAVSHAMMAKSGKSLVEICTAQGFKLIEVDDADAGKSGKPGIKVNHECAVCAAASAPPSPPSTTHHVVLSPASSGIIAVGTSSFAFADALYLSPPPTGPPLN